MKALIAGNPKAEDFVALCRGWGNGWSASPEFLVHAYRPLNLPHISNFCHTVIIPETCVEIVI